MPQLTQDDIRKHYESAWKTSDDNATDETGLTYSNPIEDSVMYPIYEQLLNDLKITVNGGQVLDVGAGSGRWVRFFFKRFTPALLMGIDFTQAAVDLLSKRYCTGPIAATFRTADLTQPELDLGQKFDLINVMNVLFHIPEPDRFRHAMQNLAAHLAPGGRIVTTEYLPRQTMRTDWMLVRSRYEFEAAAAAVGLRIIDTRASCFFSNDPMGLEPQAIAVRTHFDSVRTGMRQILSAPLDPAAKAFFIKLLSDVESATISFCKEHISPAEMPSQKLVVLGA